MKSHLLRSFLIILSAALLGCGINPFGSTSFRSAKLSRNGMIARWYLNETSGATAPGGADFFDSSGNGNHAINTGGASYGNSGKYGASAGFNGANDYALAPQNTPMELSNDLTVAAWVYPTSLSSRKSFFSTRLTEKSGSFQIEVGTGSFGTAVVAVSSPGVFNAQTVNNVLTLNAWNHIVYTRTIGSTINQRIYVNGTSVALVTDAPVAIQNNSDSIEIGRCLSIASYFQGNLEDISVWNRALSPSEISLLYQNDFAN